MHLRTAWAYAARAYELGNQIVEQGGKLLQESSVENEAILDKAIECQQNEHQKQGENK